MTPGPGMPGTKTTSAKVVIPFYIYAAFSFAVATLLLFLSPEAFTGHYFHPRILSITHVMALGWGAMMIFGAGHQLIPVMIEGKLYSNILAQFTLWSAGIGIPLLAYGFYIFSFGLVTQVGGLLVLAGMIFFLLNIALSMSRGNHNNVHATFVMTGIFWLLLTAVVGVLLVYNFSFAILSRDSFHYLPLHAHMGIVGWFLLVVMGVGSRLIPMFLISKYNNVRLLWWIYGLVNGGLMLFFTAFLFFPSLLINIVCLAAICSGVILFIFFCRQAFKERIRKKTEPQLRIALASGWMMLLPILILAGMLSAIWIAIPGKIALVYGFLIFFGWITAMILGMAFKTLPFILWNRKFHSMAGKGKTPNPRELFSRPIFVWMTIFYIAGFVGFIVGILSSLIVILKVSAAMLIITALLYNTNIFKMLRFQSK